MYPKKPKQPIEIPYRIGGSVTGNTFAGREDIYRKLKALWIDNDSPYSVILYGDRHMGKTSILRNIPKHWEDKIELVYVNLQRLGAISQGLGEVLIAITDELAETLNIEPPKDDDLLTLPQRTFHRYLKTICKQLGEKRLIIALDEFETIKTLIEIPSNFLFLLRGINQLSPKIAFVFVGTYAIEQMMADCFYPFTALDYIHVGRISSAATRQILINPNLINPNDFPLEYTEEALDFIHHFTQGHPFLVQLAGFYLVHRYNEQVFEECCQRDIQLTKKDVDAILPNISTKVLKQRYLFDESIVAFFETNSGMER